MIFIAALKSLSPTKLNVFSPAFVRIHTERCFGGGGAGFGAGLGVGLAAATFFGAAFFADDTATKGIVAVFDVIVVDFYFGDAVV